MFIRGFYSEQALVGSWQCREGVSLQSTTIRYYERVSNQVFECEAGVIVFWGQVIVRPANLLKHILFALDSSKRSAMEESRLVQHVPVQYSRDNKRERRKRETCRLTISSFWPKLVLWPLAD